MESDDEDIVLSKLLKKSKKSITLVKSPKTRSDSKRSKTKKTSSKRSRTKKTSSKRSKTKKTSSKRSKTKKTSSKRSKTKKTSSKRSRTKKMSSKRSRTKKMSSKRSRTRTNKVSKRVSRTDDKWIKIKLAMTYSPKKGWDDDLETHMKKYFGKVIIWDLLEGVSSSGLDKLKISKNQISFNVSYNDLKRVFGKIDKRNIKKKIKEFDPSKMDNGFWKKGNRTIKIKKISIKN